MDYRQILVTEEDSILIITLNREDKLNALNRELLSELESAAAKLYKDSHYKGLIITGKGLKAFAAGADIAEFEGMGSVEARKMSESGHAVMNLLERSPKPVVAAVNGFALGGGCELAMACHLRYASPNARFGQPEINLGIIPGYGGTQRLVQLAGKGRAMELLLTGDMIDAEEAHRIGLVNKIYPLETLLSECKKTIEKIASKAPVAIQRTIHAVNDYFRHDTDGFESEIEQFSKCVETEDFKEGTRAFLEKRKAQFKGQ